MTDIGRNAPCPCGSGKKYKKCCLAKSFTQSGWDEFMKSKIIQDVLDFSKKHYEDVIPDAFDYFWSDFEPDKSLPDELLETAEINFWEWFVYDYVLDDKIGKTILDIYCEENAQLTQDELKVLNMMKDTVISLYEVLDVFPENGLLLKDLLLGGEYDVREKMATRSLRKWDIFATRLLYLDGKYIMSSCIYFYPIIQKVSIIEHINNCFKDYKNKFPEAFLEDFLKDYSDLFNFYWYENIRYQPPESGLLDEGSIRQPKLATMTSEPFVLSKAIFKIKDKSTVIAGLKAIKEFEPEKSNVFMWLDRSEKALIFGRVELKGEELILETNSKERLEKGKAIILNGIGEAVVHKKDEFQDIMQVMASMKDIPVQALKSGIPIELEQELYAKTMRQEYEKWFNEQIPALGGKTPLEAVKTQAGKKKVIDILKLIENSEEHNKRDGRPFFDPSWMWERLNLKKET